MAHVQDGIEEEKDQAVLHPIQPSVMEYSNAQLTVFVCKATEMIAHGF